jgi:hypothetical protein
MSVFTKKLSGASPAAAVLLAAFAALVVFAVFAAGILSSCGGGGGGGGGTPRTAVYKNSSTAGDLYELKITEGGAGDTYELIVTQCKGQVKKSRGAAQQSGTTFTLKPANAGAGNTISITVQADLITALTITGSVLYTDGSAATAPGTFLADKTALRAAIKKAAAAKTGVVVASSSAEVPQGTQWVTVSDLTALNSTISAAEAQAANAGAAQTAVDTAAAALTAAIFVFDNAKSDGSGSVSMANRTVLNEKITAAKGLKTGVVAAADGNSLAPGTVWVPTAAMSVFNTAIAAAEEAATDITKTQTEIDGAVTALTSAMNTFTLAKNTVTVVDKEALGDAIAAAMAAKDGVIAAADDSGLSPGTVWVPTAAMGALNTAITAARTVDENASAAQIEVNNAVAALNQAITDFNGAKQTVAAGVTLTLINIPVAITGNVAVCLSPDGYSPDVIGAGAVSDRSVTVELHEYSGDRSNPLGDPWADDGGAYYIMILYGEDYAYRYVSDLDQPKKTLNQAMTAPGSGIINAGSGFGFDGPIPPKTGRITGTLTIKGFPSGTGVEAIAMIAQQPGWASHYITLDPAAISGTSLTNYPFDIGLYGQDMMGAFEPSAPVYFYVSIAFDDETHWNLYFGDSVSGWTVDHNATNNPGDIGEQTIPVTKVVSGTATLALPGGITMEWARVGIAGNGGPGDSIYAWDWEGPVNNEAWKVRISTASTGGKFMAGAGTAGGTTYYKFDVGTWSGSATGNTVNYTFTAGDIISLPQP